MTGSGGYHVASIRHISHHCRAVHRLQLTTKQCSFLRQNSFRYTEDWLHTTASLNADENKQRRAYAVLWEKFATKIRMFTAGVKALYSDMKMAKELREKHGKLVISKKAPNVIEGVQTDMLYSRKELQFVYRVFEHSDHYPFLNGVFFPVRL